MQPPAHLSAPGVIASRAAPDGQAWPRISIVTPSYNQAQFLEDTLRSVLDQGYPNLEYIVIDGGSSDGSVEIIRRYADRLNYWVSEKDNGHYHAINKGFARATGEVMAWINADDKYCPWTLETVGGIFAALPQVQWLTSQTQLFWNKQGELIHASFAEPFARSRFLRGQNLANHPRFTHWIQQESTFWRRDLWEKAGSRVDDSLSIAGDFDLWAKFFEHTELAGTRIPLAGWRVHGENRSDNRDVYYREAGAVLARYRRQTIHHPALVRLLGWVLRRTGRGGQRYGSRTATVFFTQELQRWHYRLRYVV